MGDLTLDPGVVLDPGDPGPQGPQRDPWTSALQLSLQLRAQAVRILHRVELDEAARVLDGVAVHGPTVLADPGGNQIFKLVRCHAGFEGVKNFNWGQIPINYAKGI